MIVLDASALLELILNTPTGRFVAGHLVDPEQGLHAPHLVDVEIAQALRRFVRAREIAAAEAGVALGTLRDLDLERHAHEPLLDRIWAWRDNLTAYDAAYVALAEALDAPLLTCDRRLARSSPAAGRARLVEA